MEFKSSLHLVTDIHVKPNASAMKTIGIETPCTENWNAMTPTEKGAFCQKCAKQVHDFSQRPLHEVKRTLLELDGQNACVRMTIRQEQDLNAEFNAWIAAKKRHPRYLFMAALLLVFGLALFSCEDERDRQWIESVQQIGKQAVNDAVEHRHVTEEPAVLTPEPEVWVTEESYIMGAYSVAVDEEPPVEPPVLMEPERLIMGGGSLLYPIHVEYLEETSNPVELDENGNPYPTEFKAFAFPNPAVESTTIEIQVPQKEQALVQLIDLSGKLIREVYAAELARGTFRQAVDLTDLPSGLYLIVIRSKDFRETVRVVKN